MRDAVDAALRDFFASRRPVVAGVGAEFAEAADLLEEFVLRGGKRMRPLFAWTGWLCAGGAATGDSADAMIRACSALELVQACALIHDDFIDSSDTRRGHPTVHVDVARRHREVGWSGDSAHFGAGVAVLLGDLALAWADDMLRECGLPADAQERISPMWSAMRTEVLGGQLLDVVTESCGDESFDAAMRVNRFKTAAYTVERPLQLGASAADADPAMLRVFGGLGIDLGIAFQLRDDLLGVFGDPAVTGKPSGDDLCEGKRTVLLALALAEADSADPDSAALLRSSIGTDLTHAQVAGLREIISGLGAVDEVERMIAELTDRAHTALDAGSATGEGALLLRSMITAAAHRRL
ncbi:polyprenyl synthetase family protein [Tomitella cavernea]|uniref:Polyprenyl synthetase family protein n=1 Tax=Tomitella cavernea TaxID=1387982 RepID=A0ABP9CVL0_9ACTN|nr:polyprenyl synthetase family protein [Tomitella cavernea]